MNKADLWRAKSRAMAVEEAVDLPLPSGMTIKARRPGPAFLAGHGRLPLSLATAAMAGEGVALTPADERNKEVVEFAAFMRDLLVYCVVEPAISLTPGPDEMHPRQIPNDDVDYILAWAMRGSEAMSLETFRQRGHDARAGNDSAKVPPAAVDPDGIEGPRHSAEFRPRRGRGAAADRAGK